MPRVNGNSEEDLPLQVSLLDLAERDGGPGAAVQLCCCPRFAARVPAVRVRTLRVAAVLLAACGVVLHSASPYDLTCPPQLSVCPLRRVDLSAVLPADLWAVGLLAGIVSRSGGALADISDKVHCTIRGDDAAHDTFTCSTSSQWHAGDAIVFLQVTPITYIATRDRAARATQHRAPTATYSSLQRRTISTHAQQLKTRIWTTMDLIRVLHYCSEPRLDRC